MKYSYDILIPNGNVSIIFAMKPIWIVQKVKLWFDKLAFGVFDLIWKEFAFQSNFFDYWTLNIVTSTVSTMGILHGNNITWICNCVDILWKQTAYKGAVRAHLIEVYNTIIGWAFYWPPRFTRNARVTM